MSCRFPGDGDSVERFWNLICEGRSAYSENPERWNPDAFHFPQKKLNTSLPRGAHFLKQDVAAFDANFFNISKAEAEAMDPQQRMVMETTVEAMDQGGLPASKLSGTQTGVWMANFTSDYREMLYRDPESAPMYTLAGASNTSTSNRISYFFNFKGPSFTLNTACSSSLVATHLACQSLSLGETSTAIVGGTSLLLNPDLFMFLSNQNFLAADGRCKAFDESGDGYGRGEGAAVVILKRIDDAIADGDPIRAVIRGSSVNQDGRTKGMTLPSADAQVQLIQTAYKNAGVSMSETRYVEAHGTGTRAGDTTETEALSRTLSEGRSPSDRLLIGSVKANIGHLEACAGLASIIKCVRILETGYIPPTPSYKKGSPGVKWDEWKLKVPTAMTRWPTDGLRRLSTQGFGYGGTNSHLVMDDAYHYLESRGLKGNHCTIDLAQTQINGLKSIIAKNRPRVFCFSAQDRDGLKRMRTSLSQHLAGKGGKLALVEDDSYLGDLSYTLSQRRNRLQWRTFLIASSLAQLQRALLEEPWPNPETRSSARTTRIGFIFTGQGAQWAEMGIHLMKYDVFRNSIQRSSRYIKETLHCQWDVIEELSKPNDSSRLGLAIFSQTICTVLQVALVDLLATWNVAPSSVAGHSSGEIAAAYCLGVLSQEDAVKIAYYRGVLSSEMKEADSSLRGAMMAVGASPAEVQPHIDTLTQGVVVVACINSPSSITASGDVPAIDELEAKLQQKGIFARKLKVDTAYHSPHMQTIAGDYFDAISDISTNPALPDRQMHSSVVGKAIAPHELGASNWVRNLVSPVRFADAVHDLVRPMGENGERATENAVDLLIEVGPHPALQGPVNQTLKHYGVNGVEYLSILRRGQNDELMALSCIGSLLSADIAVDVSAVHGDESNKPLVDLPAYPWNHSARFWSESRISREYRLRKHPRLPLLGAPCPVMDAEERQWRGFIRLTEEPWVREHVIQDAILYPAAGFLAMAIEAAIQKTTDEDQTIESINGVRLRDIQIHTALVLEEDTVPEVILTFRPHQAGTLDSSSTWTEFTINSCTDGQQPVKNCSGILIVEKEAAEGSSMQVERNEEATQAQTKYNELRTGCSTEVNAKDFYSRLDKLGLQYGPSFARLTQISHDNETGSCVGKLEIPDFESMNPPWRERDHIVHPTVLDSIFHLMFAAMLGHQNGLKGTLVPTSISEIFVSTKIPFQPGIQLNGFASSSPFGFREWVSDINILDDVTTKSHIRIRGFTCADVSYGGSMSENEFVKPITFTDTWTSILDLVPTEGLEQTAETTFSDITLVLPQTLEGVYTDMASNLEELLALKGISTSRLQWNAENVATLHGKSCIILTDLQRSLLADMSEEDFNLLKDLILQSQSLLWVSGDIGPQASLVAGLARSVRNEVPGMDFKTLEITKTSLNKFSEIIDRVLLHAGPDTEFVAIDGQAGVRRLLEDQPRNESLATILGNFPAKVKHVPLKDAAGPVKLGIRNPGMLDSLCFERDDIPNTPLKDGTVEVDVKATGINFRDIMVAMGQIPDSLLGFEGAGIVRRLAADVTTVRPGDRVCFLAHGAHRTVHRIRAEYAVPIPPDMPFADAAGLLLAHSTAWYSLKKMANIEAGQTILIHAAAGGVGQAAVMLAQHVGLEIFATVGSDDKRELIKTRYGIPEDHIFNSRDLSFVQGVMRMTKGVGVDVILNSLSGEALRQTWSCIAPFGTFIEIGMKDILGNTRLDMRPFIRDATFTFINLNHLERDRPRLMAEILHSSMDLINAGITKPIYPVTDYPISQVEQSFRVMQAGKHRGKLTLTYGNEDVVPVVDSFRSAELSADGCYMLVGGLGGLGRSLAQLFVRLGAKKLCFLSRSGAESSSAQNLVKELKSQGAEVLVCKCDVADASSLQNAIQLCSTSLGLVRGVVQCAMVLRDSVFENMSYQQWIESTQPKVQGSWNLHSCFPDVDFFLILSSFAGVFGSRGQSNYAAAGAYEDALSAYRHSLGMKGTTIDLGIMQDVGVLAEKGITDYLREWEGPCGIREAEFHALINHTLACELSGEPSPSQIATGFATSRTVQKSGIRTPFYFSDPRFSILAQSGVTESADSERETASVQTQLTKALSIAEAASAITNALARRLADSLQSPISEIDTAQPLHAFGIDSLVAVEYANWVFKEIKAKVTVFDLLANVPITSLAEKLVSKSTLIAHIPVEIH
ncbi:polyketide synthase [Penicillium angulare]|uniref:polyketide synthase n=1 Tax=Penicillium angulare TaxID=116970 RepID=UPI0025412FF3|nr:polyketide synthase [Penicillium angulare]KAJ5273172.1 polyketide synthase [Penicillium angulare]